MNGQIRATVKAIDTFAPANLQDADFGSGTRTEPKYSIGDLHASYSSRLYKTIFSIVKNQEDAEDALQETFLRAWLALHTFEGRSAVYSWLTRIAMNTAFELLRKRRNRGEISVDSQVDDNGEVFQLEIKDPSPNPEQLHDLSQRRRTLQQAIQKLDDGLKGPIQMRINNEYSVKEIGKTLNISEGAVKVRLHRARVRLSALQETA
jgi:RNA polymerase sigma-70 factor (ECF subfamily)